jgi:hypothetical protein
MVRLPNVTVGQDPPEKGGTTVNSVQRQMFDLHGVCWEAVHFPNVLPFADTLAALVGPEEVAHLRQEARAALAFTGGLKSYIDGNYQDTVTMLMLRLLTEPDRAERLARAYGTIIREGLDTVGVDVRATSDEWFTPPTG